MIFKLKEKFKPIIVDRTTRRLVIVSLILLLLTWVLILGRLFPLIARGAIVFLHYNVYLNVNDVGPAIYALIPAAIGTVILAVNMILAARLYGPNRGNAIVLLAITSFYELLVLVAGFFIVLINLSR